MTKRSKTNKISVTPRRRNIFCILECLATCSRGKNVNDHVPERFFCIVVVVAVDRFYIALLSALEQTHCARM